MSTEFERLKRTMARRGHFDDYSVDGFQYETSTGELAWHITAWPGRDPINSYWVKSGKFFGVKMHIFPNYLNEIQIEISGEVQGISDAERKAVLKAIAEWEKTEEA